MNATAILRSDVAGNESASVPRVAWVGAGFLTSVGIPKTFLRAFANKYGSDGIHTVKLGDARQCCRVYSVEAVNREIGGFSTTKKGQLK